MGLQEKQLAQARENSTNAVSIYSPPANITAIVKTIVICNQTSSVATFRIFVDDDGTTYDQTTAIFYDASIAANTTIQIETFMAMNNQLGNFAYRSSVANALTITLFGAEIR